MFLKWKNRKAIDNFIQAYKEDKVIIGDTAKYRIEVLETQNKLLSSKVYYLERKLERLNKHAKDLVKTINLEELKNIKNGNEL